MRFCTTLSACLLLTAMLSTARADFAGPDLAETAVSPNGRLIVRVKLVEDERAQEHPTFRFSYYEHDKESDSYQRRGGFQIADYNAQMLYVSNRGELVMISLSSSDFITLYSRTGKRIKAWRGEEFLTESDRKACATTGSTLQWLEEGTINGRIFDFRGPSRLIRGLSGSLAIMRFADPKVSFRFSLDLDELKITRDEGD